MADSHPVTTGPIGRIFRWAKESSSWITRIFAALLIIYLSGKAGLSYVDHPATWEEQSDRVFIFAGFMVLLVGSVVREASRIRKERYANVFEKLNAIGSHIKDLDTYLARQSGQDAVRNIVDIKRSTITDIGKVLDDFSDIFSMVTGTTCRTTVKLIFQENSTVYVYALARDSLSATTNAKTDKERYDNRRDKLEDNDDYLSIFDEKVGYFVENNLTARRDYHNTSFQIYGSRPLGTSIIHRWFTGLGWPLPYRAAMVFPVRQLEPATGGDHDVGCIGFLSVDSGFRGVFKRRFDGPLGATVASALFHPLSVYVKLIDEAEQGN